MFSNKFFAFLFNTNFFLNALAIDSAVISSCVGPIPPVTKTFLYFLDAFIISFLNYFLLLSGIILISSILIPILEQRFAIKLAFLSKVLPDNISFPIIIIEALFII